MTATRFASLQSAVCSDIALQWFVRTHVCTTPTLLLTFNPQWDTLLLQIVRMQALPFIDFAIETFGKMSLGAKSVLATLGDMGAEIFQGDDDYMYNYLTIMSK